MSGCVIIDVPKRKTEMVKKLERSVIEDKLCEFSRASVAVYDDYAYCAGAYEAIISRLIEQLPAHVQRLELKQLEQMTAMLVARKESK